MPKKKITRVAREDRKEVARITNAGMKTSAWEKVAIFGAERIYGGEGAPSHEVMLLSPRWTEYVRRVKADRVRCECCGAGHGLQVHHTYYRNDLKLWEYPIEDVLLLCDKCHRAEHRLDAHRARMKEQNGETDCDVAPSWLTMLAEDREPAKLKRRTSAEVAKEEAERDRFLRTNDSFGNYAHLKRKPKTPWDRPSP